MELSPQQDVYYIDTVSPTDYFIDTVTPSAIQLNKEKTMSIELDGPLYLGSNSMQQQVDQNTADIADLKQDVSDIESDIGSLDNLTTTDKSSLVGAINEVNTLLPPTSQRDYIDNSKAMPTGAISSNALILPEIKAYAHSTFDASKFTKVGSPVITNDGIASGFSSNDYLTIPVPNFGSSWKIKFAGTITESKQQCFLSVGTDGAYAGFLCRIEANNKTLIAINFANGSWGAVSNTSSDSISLNTFYYYELEFTGTQYIFRCSTDNKNWTILNTIDYSTNLYSNFTNFWIARYFGMNTYTPSGSIDLKQLSIIVDGVEVFSGNKTGIDTIKPDNYTVVGSPTISADGIASGFSSGNYIKIPDFDRTKAFDIIMKFTTPPDNNSIYWFIGGLGYTTDSGFVFGINTNGKLRFFLSSTGTGWNIVSGGSGTTTLSTSTQYYFRFQWTGSKYSVYTSTDKQSWIEEWSFTSSSALATSTGQYIGIGSANLDGSNNFSNGSIDLNAFKIYVNGNLVYQPCLKLPYTWSKTGSKIVDSIYRSRINDMAEQFGFAPYYTLSDTDFTLPQVELYGLIGAKTLRDSYENGINKWYLYSNRDLEQQGSCTSGVEVTLAKPFADTNYVLSVPYSAKSSTAFTPTQTGDWFAKGKGVL